MPGGTPEAPAHNKGTELTIQTSDLVKAVGLLTINWGYLELEVDKLVKVASLFVPMPIDKSGTAITVDKFLERPFRNRVDYLKKHLLDRIREYPDLARERKMIYETLSDCAIASDQRNEYMHSVIHSKEGSGTFRRERKTGAATRIDATKVCELANTVEGLVVAVTNLQFTTKRLVQAEHK
jgi:hypothetical protein